MNNKDALRKALQDLLKRYVEEIGHSDPEKHPEVIQARAALARFTKPLEV